MPVTGIHSKCHMPNSWVVIIKPNAHNRFCMAAKLFYIVQTSYFNGILHLFLRSLTTQSLMTKLSGTEVPAV